APQPPLVSLYQFFNAPSRLAYPASTLNCLLPFFFQAEDGIRDRNVTGVQTCALPISALIQLREWGKGKLVPHFIIENTNPTPGTPEARNLSGINTNWNTTLVGMIRAGSEDEFDKLVENYKTFQKNNGWDEIVKIRTEKIKNNKEKLGME